MAQEQEVKDISMSGAKMIAPTSLTIENSWNASAGRYSRKEAQELRDSIRANGVETPLKAFKNENGTYTILEGENRLTQVMILIKEGVEFKRLPVIVVPKPSEADRIAAALTSDQKVPFTMLNLGTWYSRLIDLGWNQSEISEKFGKPQAVVSNALKLASAPDGIKKLMESGKISYVPVLEILREYKGDEEKQLKVVERAVATAERKGKKKAKASDVTGVKKKSALQAFEDAIQVIEDGGHGDENEETVSILKGLLSLLGDKKSKLEDFVQCVCPDFYLLPVVKEAKVKAEGPGKKTKAKTEKSEEASAEA